MANRIACTALTGRIAMGRTNAAGTAFSGPKTDVTSDVLKAVIDKAAFHGGSFDIEGGGEKWVVTVAKASAAPMSEQPAPSDADILHVWASFVSEPTANLPLTNADKVAFAQAVLARWGAPAAVSAPSVPAFTHVAGLKLRNLQERGYVVNGYAIEKPAEGREPDRGFITHGGFVGWWLSDHAAAPQAPAGEGGAA